MALWKEATPTKPSLLTPEPVVRRDEITPVSPAPSFDPAPRRAVRDQTESVIGANITIEGKIDGAGHVRIAGHFKGDVRVDGNLTIESGAKVTGGIKANSVIIAGELDGNIIEAASVELRETGVMNGDLKAGTLTVASGSRMRGRAEFGWKDGQAAPPDRDNGNAL
jgi:cytoskeletal protein CcmA (bactofilin family)